MAKINMIALKRFRRMDGQAIVWVNKGDPYTVSSEREKEYHIKTGRGNTTPGKVD